MELLIRTILNAKDAASKDPTVILNLAPAMPPVTLDTPIPDARRNYVRLSAAIHPDRVADKSLVSDATTAFQLVVKTFELFADPTFRRNLSKIQPKKPKAVTKTVKEPITNTAAAPKPKPSKVTKKAKHSESESEEDSSSDDEEAEAALQPTGATSRSEKIPRSRTNDGCKRTTVTCPKCVTPWMPDDPRQYSLFMAYGLRVHCQLCLLLFGCATAGHRTPCCNGSFDYDTSMYDDQIQCRKCKKSMGFMYYPVTQQQIDQIEETARAEERKKADANEREARAKARATNTDEDDELLTLVGKCIVDEQCPICGKGVFSKHHAHVSACKTNPPPPKKTRQVRKFIEEDQSDDSDSEKKTRRRRAAPAAKKSAALATKKKTAPKKRRRNDYSDSD